MERTGRNPQNVFIQLGCSKVAEQKMLNYVRHHCIGKPFSNYAMVRSLVWPRETDHQSFFCAELVASILRVGGLLDTNCNPGSATPEMLHRIYAPRAAVSANPCLLREINGCNGSLIGNVCLAERLAEREALIPGNVQPRTQAAPFALTHQTPFQPARRRADSPPRGHFQSVTKVSTPVGARSSGACSARCVTNGGIHLTMDSLKFGGGSGGGGTKQRPR